MHGKERKRSQVHLYKHHHGSCNTTWTMGGALDHGRFHGLWNLKQFVWPVVISYLGTWRCDGTIWSKAGSTGPLYGPWNHTRIVWATIKLLHFGNHHRTLAKPYKWKSMSPSTGHWPNHGLWRESWWWNNVWQWEIFQGKVHSPSLLTVNLTTLCVV